MNRLVLSLCLVSTLLFTAEARAITRCEVIEDAESWVAAGVPYSQGIYGSYCPSDYCYADPLRPEPTCWRSDCSGFVSATWNESTADMYSGRTTLGFAPFNEAISYLLGSYYDLLPGDALNRDGHIMLFGGWTGSDSFFIYQESTCYSSSGITTAHRRDFNVYDSYIQTFDPIRYVGIEECPPPDQAPLGALDSAGCDAIQGWAQDPDDPASSIEVHLYFGGPAGSGAPNVAVRADVYRDDLCTAIGSCPHGFVMPSPLSLFDGQPHPVHAYGISVGGDNNAELGGSYKDLNCPATLPAGVRRHVINPDSYTAWKLDEFIDRLPVPEVEVNALPQGTDIPATPVLARADDGTPEVWLLDGEYRRHIPGPDVVTSWRFDWGAIQELPSAQVYALTVGPPWRPRPVQLVSDGAVWLVDDPMPASGTDAGTESDAGVEPSTDAGSDAEWPVVDADTDAARSQPGSWYTSDGEEGSCSVRATGHSDSGTSLVLAVVALLLARKRRGLLSIGRGDCYHDR